MEQKWIALVGDRKWEEWMAKVCKPFTRATVKYFEAKEIRQAWDWLREMPIQLNRENSEKRVKAAYVHTPLWRS